MTRDIIELNNFIVLIEQSNSEKPIVDRCGFDEDVIGLSFYGSGNVKLNIVNGKKVRSFHNTKGIAISFFANNKVQFEHNISSEKQMQCICIFSTLKNIKKLPDHEKELFTKYLDTLTKPKDNYIEGPNFFMNNDMLTAVEKIFNNQYKGSTRKVFLQSQVSELQAHFFEMISELDKNPDSISKQDREKLYQAKDILTQNIETPPSLNELSKLIELNNYKLKKNFKELFGVPVYKYLQNERLAKANELLTNSDNSIQEVAWMVGYESISSFSNAFMKKFGFRPSDIKK